MEATMNQMNALDAFLELARLCELDGDSDLGEEHVMMISTIARDHLVNYHMEFMHLRGHSGLEKSEADAANEDHTTMDADTKRGNASDDHTKSTGTGRPPDLRNLFKIFDDLDTWRNIATRIVASHVEVVDPGELAAIHDRLRGDMVTVAALAAWYALE
jgi:hypothetical protein